LDLKFASSLTQTAGELQIQQLGARILDHKNKTAPKRVLQGGSD
jgi:hypothetical protein